MPDEPIADGPFSIPIAGVRVGHWTGAGTGVTVVLAPEGTVGSAEIRGGAPATRELAVLDPMRTVSRVDAVVLSGGSAFGLATADGVMRFLAVRGQGFATAGGPVPIVPTACVFDLVESGEPPPGPDAGYAAADAAGLTTPLGRVGAGRGATVGKWRGREHAVPGGFGAAAARCDDAQVVAFAVVNAVGDVVGDDGSLLAGSTAPADAPGFPDPAPFEEQGAEDRANTTLVVVVTDAVCDKPACHLVAQSAHDGFARALRPAHTRFDGDVSIALATGVVETHLDRLRAVAADVVAEAIRAACR
jgi:L-aminopeptidase/D-esterase-like protein